MAPFRRQNQLVQTPPKKVNKESSRFEEPKWKLGYKAGSNSRIQFASNGSKLGPRNLNPVRHLKWALVWGCQGTMVLTYMWGKLHLHCVESQTDWQRTPWALENEFTGQESLWEQGITNTLALAIDKMLYI